MADEQDLYSGYYQPDDDDEFGLGIPGGVSRSSFGLTMDDFSLSDVMRKIEADKDRKIQEYKDLTTKANQQLNEDLSPGQAFAASAIALLPILGGLAFGGDQRYAAAAATAKDSSTAATGYLGALEKQKETDAKQTLLEANIVKEEVDLANKLQASMPLEVMKQQGLDKRAQYNRDSVLAARDRIPASQLAEPNSARQAEKRLGLPEGSVQTNQQLRQADERYYMSGMGRLPQNEGITPVEGAVLSDKESAEIATARITLQQAGVSIPRVINILDNRGRYEMSAIQRNPKMAEELGRDIQTIRSTFLAILAAEKQGNPVFSGILSNQDTDLLKSVVPEMTTTDPLEGFLNWVNKSTDVDKGRLKEILAKTQRSYGLAIRGRINDPIVERDFFGTQQKQVPAEIQQLMAQQQQDMAELEKLKAMMAPTPTPTPMR